MPINFFKCYNHKELQDPHCVPTPKPRVYVRSWESWWYPGRDSASPGQFYRCSSIDQISVAYLLGPKQRLEGYSTLQRLGALLTG